MHISEPYEPYDKVLANISNAEARSQPVAVAQGNPAGEGGGSPAEVAKERAFNGEQVR